MKLSCLPVSLYPDFKSGAMTIADWSAVAAGLGLDTIDLSTLITRRDRTKSILPRVRRVHVADILESETISPVCIGDGIVPLREIFAFLRKKEFSGAYSIEEASFAGVAGVKRAVETTRNLWRTSL